MNQKNSLPSFVFLIGVVVLVVGLIGQFGGSNVVPIPDPQPTPAPVQLPGSWVLLVEETQERTPQSMAVAVEFAERAVAEVRGLKWRLYDDDMAEAAEYVQALAGYGCTVPAVLILDPDGKSIGACDEMDLAKIDAEVRRVTGL